MKKNWFTFIFALIGTVTMYFITDFVISILAELLAAESSQDVITMFTESYMTLTYVFCALNLLFGFWAVYKKGGCTALKVFSVFLLILGGLIIYLIPCIFNLIGASKGKNKFIKYEAEQKARAELNAQ